MRLLLLWLGLLVLAGISPARANVTDTTYYFYGTCQDCDGIAQAQLVLQNYTLGNTIGDSNFVSFTYDGTNLVSGYTVTGTSEYYSDSMTGMISAPLPAAEFFTIDPNNGGQYFLSENTGYWCVGGSCTGDYGFANQWSNTVPEPASAAVMGCALVGLGLLRRRRR